MVAQVVPAVMAQMPMAVDTEVHWREYAALAASRAAVIADACVQAASYVRQYGDVTWTDLNLGEYPTRGALNVQLEPSTKLLSSLGACACCGAKAWKASGPGWAACGICAMTASRTVPTGDT
jgi:hypothetical protein